MAPEQTGRMNRSVDSRSDLYSLGVTLYQTLGGSLPFTASDPMEWIHCHIARKPTPLSERLENVPAPVSAIIMKLLAKTAEERCQTAAGVGADLQRRIQDLQRLLVLRPAYDGRSSPGFTSRYQEMQAGLGHHDARTQSGVATRPKGTVLSLRQNVCPNLGRTGLARASCETAATASHRDTPIVTA